MFISTNHTQIDEQVERYTRALTAMLRCNVEDCQQDWDAYTSTLTFVYNYQMSRFTNPRLFNMALNRRIPYFTKRSYNVHKKNAYRCRTTRWISCSTTKLIGLRLHFLTSPLKTIQLGFWPASLQWSWKNNDWRLCVYWFIECVTKGPKSGHAVKRLYQV